MLITCKICRSLNCPPKQHARAGAPAAGDLTRHSRGSLSSLICCSRRRGWFHSATRRLKMTIGRSAFRISATDWSFPLFRLFLGGTPPCPSSGKSAAATVLLLSFLQRKFNQTSKFKYNFKNLEIIIKTGVGRVFGRFIRCLVALRCVTTPSTLPWPTFGTVPLFLYLSVSIIINYYIARIVIIIYPCETIAKRIRCGLYSIHIGFGQDDAISDSTDVTALTTVITSLNNLICFCNVL